MSWAEIVQILVENDIDVYIDYESKFFTCPECGEPIFECDYNEFIGFDCPCCENDLLCM